MNSSKFLSVIESKGKKDCLVNIRKEKEKLNDSFQTDNQKSSHQFRNSLEMLELKIVEYVRKFPYSTEEQIFRETIYLTKELKLSQS